MTVAPLTFGRLWALMFTVFVDMVGFLMIVPVLPLFAEDRGASVFEVGLMVSVYAVAQLATAPLWGRVSDRRGRRPMLMLGISIAFVAYLIFALACSDWAMARVSSWVLIGLLYVSRLVQGAGGATTGVVQAYVGDAIIADDRAKALGWISAATAFGVMLGPALGSLSAVVGPAVPGLVAAALCLANLAFVRRFLPESSTAEARAHAVSSPGLSLRQRMAQVLAHPRRPVERLITVYGVGMMAFMAMNAMLALFLQARFGMTAKTIGYVYTFIGAISLVMRSVLLGPAVGRFGERGVMRLGLAALAAGFALQPLAPTLFAFFAAVSLIPIGTALLFPATTSLVSRYADQHELGAVMGVQQAYGGVARLVGPIWAGAAYQLSGPGAPFWISSALAAATLAFALGLEPPPKPRSLS